MFSQISRIPDFDMTILSKKVQLIRRCLRYLITKTFIPEVLVLGGGLWRCKSHFPIKFLAKAHFQGYNFSAISNSYW